MGHISIISWRKNPSDLHLEDGDASLIFQGLDLINTGTRMQTSADELATGISISQCDDCRKCWLEARKISGIPSWSETPGGRGRKINLAEIASALREGGWGDTDYKGRCEICLVTQAPIFAKAVLTLKNTVLKKFFRTYSLRIKYFKSYIKNYQDTLAYKFHVQAVTCMFKELPARNRTAFKGLSEIMAMLELL